MPTMNPTDALNQARDSIQRIQQRLAELYAVAPSFQDNADIQASVARNHALFQQAAQQLQHPALRIATIGTTGAGKSTLVNGLVGRQIAPMDAAELSAGVLHLVHAERNRLLIEEPRGADGQHFDGLWQAKDVYDETDQDMYEHVREKVFKVYHERKEKATLPVPRVRIEGPLLPAVSRELLDMPAGVGVEIFDLPGLNSTHDQHNLKVIQSYLNACFSVVIMDYCQTDKENRKKLLGEVKKVVDALGGKTDATLFVLNRVDRRNREDDSLNDYLASFAADIKDHLELRITPELIPISALPLFYGQCAWGATVPRPQHSPTTSPALQWSYFDAFAQDCAGMIRARGKENREIREWFRQREDAESLSEEDMHQWLEWCWDWSYGLELWKVLRNRIADRFPEIVIAPALIQSLAGLGDLLQKLDDYLQVQRQESREAVAAKKLQLEEQFEELQVFLDREHEDFHHDLQSAIDELAEAMGSGESERIALALQSLFSRDTKGANPSSEEALRRTVQDARSDLVDTIILPVRDYFLNMRDDNELRETLGMALPAEERDKLVKCASRMRARGLADDRVENGWSIDAYEDEKSELERLEGAINALQALFAAVREAMATRVGFVLQGRSRSIETAFTGLLERGIEDIEAKIHQDLPEVAASLMAKFRDKRAAASPLSLPVKLFMLPDPQPTNRTVEQPDGTRTETRQSGSCFKSEIKREVPKFKTRAVRSVTLPGANAMAEQWEAGIKAAEGDLWRTLSQWFQDTSLAQRTLFREAAKEVQGYLGNLYEQRLRQNQEEFERRQEEMNALENFKSALYVELDKLRKTGDSGEV
jgi:hypothetical protein